MADGERHRRFDTILSVASLLVSMMGLGSIWLTYQNIRDARVSARVNTYQLMVKQASDANALLLARPELRPYFRDAQNLAPDDPDFNRVAVLAEMRLDAYDALMTFPWLLGESKIEGWRNTIRLELSRSPVMCGVLAGRTTNYGDDLVKIGRVACGRNPTSDRRP
jgi:hypothetical protein